MNYEFLSRLILSRITESAEKRCIEENIKLTFYFTFQLYDPTRIPESVFLCFPERCVRVCLRVRMASRARVEGCVEWNVKNPGYYMETINNVCIPLITRDQNQVCD